MGAGRRLRHGFVGVVATLTLLPTAMSGCFRYVETSDPTPFVPVDVRLRVEATPGESALTNEEGYVTGRLLGWTEEAAILVWRSGPNMAGFSTPRHRDVEIPRRLVLSVEVREMDRTKTAMIVTGAAILSAISWFGVLQSGFADGSPGPADTGDVTIIPIY